MSLFDVVPIVTQEEFLKSGRMADEAPDPESGEVRENLGQVVGVCFEIDLVPDRIADLTISRVRKSGDEVVDPGKPDETRRVLLGLGRNSGPGEMTQVGESPALDDAARPHNAYATQSASTSARMWLASRTVLPFWRSSSIHLRNSASISGSRPAVGSSRINSSTSPARAATKATF